MPLDQKLKPLGYVRRQPGYVANDLEQRCNRPVATSAFFEIVSLSLHLLRGT